MNKKVDKVATPWRNRTSVVRNSAYVRMLVRGSAIELRGDVRDGAASQ